LVHGPGDVADSQGTLSHATASVKMQIKLLLPWTWL